MRSLGQFQTFTRTKSTKKNTRHQRHQEAQKAQKRNQAKAQNVNKRTKIKNPLKKDLSGKK